MRRILTIIAGSMAAVALAWWVGHLAGDLTLHIADLTIETSLPVVILAQALIIAVIYALFRVIATIFGLPGAFRSSSSQARRRRGDEAVTQTLVALAAQDAQGAARAAARARKLLGETPQTLMLAATAHGLAGKHEDEAAALTALADRKDSALVGLRGLLRLAVAQGDYARAAELAKAAHKAHPNASWLREERMQLAVRNGAWSEAMALTKDSALRAAFAAAASIEEPDAEAARKLARDAFKVEPGLTAGALRYAGLLRQQGRERAAQDVLRRAWGAAPHPALAELALAQTTTPTERLKLAVSLVREARRHPESLFLLARLTFEAGEREEAKRLADAARASGVTERRMFVLLADLATADANGQALQAAQAAAATAEPDPTWRCISCGSLAEDWSAACQVCHAPGKLSWGAPGRAAAEVSGEAA